MQFYFIGLDQLKYGTHFSYSKVACHRYPKSATLREYRYEKDAISKLSDSLGDTKYETLVKVKDLNDTATVFNCHVCNPKEYFDKHKH